MNDKDRFLCSLSASKEKRQDLWALFAFNYEIAKTREIVSEPTIGYIRLQWWRDALDKVYQGSDIPEHEIVGALADIIVRYDLPRDQFELLIAAREFDLENKAIPSMGAMFHYARHTNVPLLRLCALVLGTDIKDEWLDYIGVNYGATGLVRSMAYQITNGYCFLPSDVMEVRGVTKSVILSQEQLFERRDVILDIFAGLKENIPHDFKAAQLPSFFKYSYDLTKHYKKRIKLFRYNMLDSKLNNPSVVFLLRSLLFK